MDVSPDGKTLLTVVDDPWDPLATRSYLVPLDTQKPRPLNSKAFKGSRFSSDGNGIVGIGYAKSDGKPVLASLSVVAVRDGSDRMIPVLDKVREVKDACWSPDGKRIAYLWLEEIDGPGGRGQAKRSVARVTISDTDGRNAKTIISRDDDKAIYGIDWK